MGTVMLSREFEYTFQSNISSLGVLLATSIAFTAVNTEAERNHIVHTAHSSTQKYSREPQLQKIFLLWDYQHLSVGLPWFWLRQS